MELFQAKDHYILQSGDKALWCSRKDGSMSVRPGKFIQRCCAAVYNVLSSVYLSLYFLQGRKLGNKNIRATYWLYAIHVKHSLTIQT